MQPAASRRRAHALLALALLALPAWAQAAPGPCLDAFGIVPGQGLACPVPGGWLVRLADGSLLATHGPDPLPPGQRIAGQGQGLLENGDGPLTDGLHAACVSARSALAIPLGLAGGGTLSTLDAACKPPPARAADCVADPAAEAHGLLVYARPAAKPDRFPTMAPRIRLWFEQANGILRGEAEEAGEAAAYRMACGPDGKALVASAALPTDSCCDSFGSIAGDLGSLGFASPLAKYWVWYDDPVDCACGGQGNLWHDDRPGAENRNNMGPSYGMTYAVEGWFVMMHENGHNLGAVQLSAPRTTGAFHCNDGMDVMCYDDNGPLAAYDPHACPDLRHFDCGHDDYFHPHPPAGSYLLHHWNLGSPVNRYVSFREAALLPSAPLAPAAVPGPGPREATLHWLPPLAEGASPVHAYRVYRSLPGQVLGGESFHAEVQGTSLTDTLALNAYTYRVSAVNAHGEGGLTDAVPAAPGV